MWPSHLPVLQSYDLLVNAQGYGHMGKIPGQIPSTWEYHMSALKTTQTSLCRAYTPEDKASQLKLWKLAYRVVKSTNFATKSAVLKHL